MFDLAQVVKSMSAPRLPDCFQKVPKKVTIEIGRASCRERVCLGV